MTATCLVCRSEFTKNRALKVYCSASCYKRANYLRHRKVAPPRSACARCASPIAPAGKGQRSDRMFCSKACLKADYYARHRETISRDSRAIYRRVEHQKPCESCGAVFEARRRKSRFCGQACYHRWYRTTPRRFASIRVHNKTREARAKGASSAEPVDRVALFTRDGWRCQLCGVSTPMALLGTRSATAPTIDHIVPLSRGGDHSYQNTQCACLACNRSKGAKVMGQLRWL